MNSILIQGATSLLLLTLWSKYSQYFQLQFLTHYQTRAYFSIKTPLFLFFAESHLVDSVISAFAKILLMSSFTTFITIVIKKYFYIWFCVISPRFILFGHHCKSFSSRFLKTKKFGAYIFSKKVKIVQFLANSGQF